MELRGTPVFLKPDPCVDCMQSPPAINLRIASPGSTQIRTPVAAPVANACVERVTGTLRRKPLDHVVILNQRQLKRLLSSYLDFCDPWRTHRSFVQDAPGGRPVRLAELGQISGLPVTQGLHHYFIPGVV